MLIVLKKISCLVFLNFIIFICNKMDNNKNKHIDLDEKQIIKQFELISDKNLKIMLLEQQKVELQNAFNEIQNSWSYKIGRMITAIILSPITIFKNFIKFSATTASHFPWFTNFIKKMIHLIPPLEAKVLSMIDHPSLNTTKETLILTDEGQKIYDELMMRIEKQK